MLKALTSIVLILVFAGSLFASSHERECGMSGMDGMDCCQKAGMQTNAPDVQAARLCCAINCPQSGPVQTGKVTPRTAPHAVATQHLSVAQSPFMAPQPPSRLRPARDYPSNSPPTYILHLSLLI
jgi:hypothetical protein